MKELIWIEIDKSRIKNNIATVRKIIGDKVLLSPCIKSNAYGHGLVPMAKLCMDYGANWLTINSIEEARELRAGGVTAPILIIGHVQKSDLDELARLKIKIFVSDDEEVIALNEAAKKRDTVIPVHIKIDTGMHRQGATPEESLALANLITDLPNLELEGVATHFANSDEIEKPDYFKNQLALFQKITKKLRDKKLIIQCANSAATLLYPEAHFDLVRPGKAIYGYYPSPLIEKMCFKKGVELLPALSLKTKIALIKEIPADSYVGYGCTYKTTRPTKIATIPIGYYDGVDRKLSNCGWFLIGGQKAPILGRVCMNITIIDITDIPNVKTEDEVVIIGRQGQEKITIENITDLVGTIGYEILTRLRASIPRYYV